MSRTDIAARLARLGAGIAQARRSAREGVLLDLASFQDEIEGLCAEAQRVSGTEARPLHDQLIALVDEINQLSQELGRRLDAVRGELRTMSNAERIRQTYGRDQGGS